MKYKKYKDFKYVLKNKNDNAAEKAFKKYIDSIIEKPDSIPDSENANVINHSAFEGITDLIIPKRIKYIGACAFAKNKDLKSIKILGPAHLAQDCFNGCDVENVFVNNVVEIGPYCFWHCNNLSKLSLPHVIKAGDRAIAKCENLLEVIAGRLSDFGNLIYDCPKITHAYIGNNNKSQEKKIDINAIQLCPNLKSISLSRDVSIEIFKHLREIWRGNMSSEDLKVFPGFGSLVPEKIPDSKSGQAVTQKPEEKVPDSKPEPKPSKIYKVNKNGWVAECTSEETYKKLSDLAESGGLLPAGDSIAEMSKFPDLIKIKLPDYIKEIPDFCFSQCYKLRSIIARGVETVGDHALYCTFSAERVDLRNAKLAEADAFNGCGFNVKGTKFILNNLEEAHQLAFWQTGAKKLNLPKLTKVAPNAIEGNSVLETINAPKAEFGYLSVGDNPNLEKITARSIHEHAVYGSPKWEMSKNKNKVRKQLTDQSDHIRG